MNLVDKYRYLCLFLGATKERRIILHNILKDKKPAVNNLASKASQQ